MWWLYGHRVSHSGQMDGSIMEIGIGGFSFLLIAFDEWFLSAPTVQGFRERNRF